MRSLLRIDQSAMLLAINMPGSCIEHWLIMMQNFLQSCANSAKFALALPAQSCRFLSIQINSTVSEWASASAASSQTAGEIWPGLCHTGHMHPLWWFEIACLSRLEQLLCSQRGAERARPQKDASTEAALAACSFGRYSCCRPSRVTIILNLLRISFMLSCKASSCRGVRQDSSIHGPASAMLSIA